MTDETTQALLPCPFCGGEALRFTLPEDGLGNGGGDVITCTRCQASSHVEFGRKENLVDRWNTRLAHSLPSQADETSGEMRLRTINHEIRDDLIAAAPETVAFEDLIAWLSTVRHFSWTWTANTRCKYVDIRIDTRRGAFAILDRDGNKITLDELRHQHRAALTKGADRHD